MVLLYKVYDIENYFILLFKHLVESEGLNSLISLTKYELEKKHRSKVDRFILEFVTGIYQNASSDDR